MHWRPESMPVLSSGTDIKGKCAPRASLNSSAGMQARSQSQRLRVQDEGWMHDRDPSTWIDQWRRSTRLQATLTSPARASQEIEDRVAMSG